MNAATRKGKKEVVAVVSDDSDRSVSQTFNNLFDYSTLNVLCLCQIYVVTNVNNSCYNFSEEDSIVSSWKKKDQEKKMAREQKIKEREEQ